MEDQNDFILQVPDDETIAYCRTVSVEKNQTGFPLECAAKYEVLVVQSGVGRLTFDDSVRDVREGDRITIPSRAKYTVRSESGVNVLIFGISER